MARFLQFIMNIKQDRIFAACQQHAHIPGEQEQRVKNKEELRVLVIPAAYHPHHGFPFDFDRDVRLTADDVLMTVPRLRTYFANGRTFPDPETLREVSHKRTYNVKYYTGIYLYNLLKANQYDVELLNCYVENDEESEQALGRGHDVYVISTTFTWCPQVKPLVERLKKINPSCTIILGGRWVYDSWRILTKHAQDRELFSAEVLERYFFTGTKTWEEVDLFIIGEHGEQTLLRVLDDVRAGRSYRRRENCAYWNGRWVFNTREEEAFDVNTLLINWDAIPREYRTWIMPSLASIGCPHQCSFCDYSSIRMYYKPLRLIRDELRLLDACEDVRTVWFVDDNFLCSKKKIREFCLMWLQERFRLSWYGLMRLSSIDESTVELLAATGLRMVLLGIESGSQRILDNMKKRATIEQYRAGFELLARYNIRAKLLLLIGFPGENDETLSETIDFINGLPGMPAIGHELVLSPFSFLPLSRLNNPRDREKYRLTGYLSNWSHATMDSSQLGDAIKRVFLETKNIFQLYPDNISIFEHENEYERARLIEIALLREELAKAQVGMKPRSELARLWDLLEEKVMHHDLRQVQLSKTPGKERGPRRESSPGASTNSDTCI